MAAITFDTLKFSNRLKQAGVPPAQAEAEAEALAEVFEVNTAALSTKQDVEQLEGRVDNKFELLRRDISGMEGRFDSKLANVEERFNNRLEKLELRLTIKLGSIVVIALGAFAALSKWIS